ncbi:hypothetical protein GXW74_16180 [Roseomonas eburnea]|uniref:DUF4239 domain-containing protein n=1 Tax=Neoroseomonas eburnea TaxID=1346889 RepID=A0A9X9XE98_9PROT|nr:hypothetical protein [Neoroseomonas eburnea]MBR0682034.1 hypothetical protein [Neoroseomonas eburnea]
MAIAVAVVVLALTFGAGMLGLYLNGLLGSAHLTEQSRDVVRLLQALVASIAALVLGLLIASASSYHRAQEEEVVRLSADLVVLDSLLEQYGPAAAGVRASLHHTLAVALAQRDAQPASARLAQRPATPGAPFTQALLALEPRTAAEHAVQARALDLVGRLAQSRAMIIAREAIGATQWPVITTVGAWLGLLFLAMGLFARTSELVVAALLIGAVAVAAAMFLILELQDGQGGLLRVSDAPLRHALERMSP